MDPVLSTIVGTLITAISVMWKKLTAEHQRLSARYDDCEKDRAAIRSELEAVKADVQLFKSCPSEPCGARRAFERAQAFDTHPN